MDVYFGTRGENAHGIYRATLETDSGQLSKATLAVEQEASPFLALHPNRKVLYAVGSIEGEAVVVAYAIGEAGSLIRLNYEVIPDGGAAHIAVHPAGKFLLTAQYGGGSVALFPLDKDGRLGTCAEVIEHEGASGVHPRQDKPHPHYIGFSPDARFALVPDLGLDQIVIYKVQSDLASIQRVGSIQTAPGGGPRHLKFSVDGKYIFLIDELTVTVSTFAFDAESGTGQLLWTTPALSEAMKATVSRNTGSEILVHPNGQYVYAANRGHDSVTAFQIDPETGRLYVIDNEPIRGAWPRNINMDASGRWLLAAGARSDSVTLFAIDPETGALNYQEGGTIEVPSPMCLLLND